MPRSASPTNQPPRGLRALIARRTPTRRLPKRERDEQARLLVVVASVVLTVLIVGILGFGYLREVVLRGGETVATIGEERISADDLLEAARPIYANLNRQADFFDENGLPQAAAQIRAQAATLPDQVLSAEIDKRLLLREAEQRQLSVADQEIDDELRQQMALEAELRRPTPTPASTAAPSPEASPTPPPTLTDSEFQQTYATFLSELGLSNQQYRELLRADLLATKAQEAIEAETPTSGEQVHARHILVADRAKAEELLQRLREGTSFEELAKSESTDPGSKDKGGDLGWFPRGVMNQPFEEAAFSATPGGEPQIVSTPSGEHILQVLERSSDRPLEEDARNLLKSTRLQEWLQQQRRDAPVQQRLSAETRSWVSKRLLGRII